MTNSIVPARPAPDATGLNLPHSARPCGRRSLVAWLVMTLVLGAAVTPARGSARYAQLSANVLKGMGVEELLVQDVISVSRRPEPWGQAASNVFALTGDGAQRTGAIRLPELLRLAPSLFVAQSSSTHWGINGRGFMRTNAYSNKLLVLVDGRTVYSPFFSNVYWDTTDIFIPDLERVEVITGPAGANWGSNAVNGVVNILTRPAHLTQGTHIYAGVGNLDEAFGGIRYGGRFGKTGAFRVYAKGAEYGATYNANGDRDGFDEARAKQAGFRLDWGSADRGEFSVHGDLFDTHRSAGAAAPAQSEGGNLVGRWTRQLADSHLLVRAYHDYLLRDEQRLYVAKTHTTDVEVEVRTLLNGRSELIWGGHYRWINDSVEETVGYAILPRKLDFALAGVFAQHEIDWREGRWRLTTGLRFEHNEFSGWEHQPNARLAWRPNTQTTAWASVARTTRTPSRIETGFFIDNPFGDDPPYLVEGNPDFRSETLYAFELGWRRALRSDLVFSVTAYQHEYDDLRSVEPGPPVIQANGVAGQSRGVEAFLDWEVTPWWRLRTGGFVMDQDTWIKAGGRDQERALGEVSFPRYQALLRSTLSLGRDTVLWLSLRHVAEVPAFENNATGMVPAYTELDARLSWQVRPNLELSLMGRNLLHRSHPEIGLDDRRREIPRRLQAAVRWTF